MRFETKLWKRSSKSFATTIPLALLFQLDLSKKYSVKWEFEPKTEQWSISFVENKKKQEKGISFNTLLWKRSQNSYATTIPHPVLVEINEEKENVITWEFSKDKSKWLIKVVEAGK